MNFNVSHRWRVIIIEIISLGAEGLALLGYLLDIPLVSTKFVLTVNFIIAVFLAIFWVQFVDNKVDVK